jgi:hypothetical protein
MAWAPEKAPEGAKGGLCGDSVVSVGGKFVFGVFIPMFREFTLDGVSQVGLYWVFVVVNYLHFVISPEVVPIGFNAEVQTGGDSLGESSFQLVDKNPA